MNIDVCPVPGDEAPRVEVEPVAGPAGQTAVAAEAPVRPALLSFCACCSLLFLFLLFASLFEEASRNQRQTHTERARAREKGGKQRQRDQHRQKGENQRRRGRHTIRETKRARNTKPEKKIEK